MADLIAQGQQRQDRWRRRLPDRDPILLGRGVQVPMAIIFVGAIGGFVAFNIIGLFVGAVVMALAHRLFIAWMAEEVSTPATDEASAPTILS